MKEKKVVAKLVDAVTGEVVYDFKEGDRIISSNADEEQIRNYNGDVKFVKLFDYTEELHDLLNNDAAFNIAIRLSKFICYDDCILRMGGHKNGKILDVHDISEVLKIPYNTLRKHISVLYKHGILAICKTGTKYNPDNIKNIIIANPDVYMRGTNINKTVISIFKEAGWNGFKEESKSAKSFSD